jgi:hypothetical protein
MYSNAPLKACFGRLFLSQCLFFKRPNRLPVAAQHRLRFGSWPCPLHLVDDNGQCAILFRNWSVRPLGGDIDTATPRLLGCELLIRGDVFDRISRSNAEDLTAVELVTVTSSDG